MSAAPVTSSSHQSFNFSNMIPTYSQVITNIIKVALPLIALAIFSSLPEVSAVYQNYYPGCYRECYRECMLERNDSFGCAVYCRITKDCL